MRQAADVPAVRDRLEEIERAMSQPVSQQDMRHLIQVREALLAEQEGRR